MLKSCRGGLGSLSLSLFAIRERFRSTKAPEVVAEMRVWKLIQHDPCHVAAPTQSFRVDWQASVGQVARVELIEIARRAGSVVPTKVFRGETEGRDRRSFAAQDRVELGQVSHARQELTGAVLVPKTIQTLEEFQRKRSQTRVQEIPVEVMSFTPKNPVTLNARVFATSLRGALNGSSPGPGGCSYDAQNLPRSWSDCSC